MKRQRSKRRTGRNHKRKNENDKGQTEYEFFSEKLDKCTEALPDLTPRHKEQVEAFVARFGPLHPSRDTEDTSI